MNNDIFPFSFFFTVCQKCPRTELPTEKNFKKVRHSKRYFYPWAASSYGSFSAEKTPFISQGFFLWGGWGGGKKNIDDLMAFMHIRNIITKKPPEACFLPENSKKSYLLLQYLLKGRSVAFWKVLWSLADSMSILNGISRSQNSALVGPKAFIIFWG